MKCLITTISPTRPYSSQSCPNSNSTKMSSACSSKWGGHLSLSRSSAGAVHLHKDCEHHKQKCLKSLWCTWGTSFEPCRPKVFVLDNHLCMGQASTLLSKSGHLNNEQSQQWSFLVQETQASSWGKNAWAGNEIYGTLSCLSKCCHL